MSIIAKFVYASDRPNRDMELETNPRRYFICGGRIRRCICLRWWHYSMQYSVLPSANRLLLLNGFKRILDLARIRANIEDRHHRGGRPFVELIEQH